MSNEKLEADHLRWIVEKQPACLMRVATDGPVLAANDAALALLGADKPSQVLGKALTGFLVPLSQEPWQGFMDKLTAGASHSLECDLLDVSGMVRSVILHGVPLAEHADASPPFFWRRATSALSVASRPPFTRASNSGIRARLTAVPR